MKRFYRLRILLAMALLTASMALVVCCASPYASVVAPVPEDIETIWAIEDTRSESEKPLVTALENGGVPLAYDQENNTFYCSVGMGNAENWPQIHLTAPGAKGVRLMFSDDYSYDWCQDAIAGGNSYQVLAYTDTEFAYFDIVFTGLPLVTLEARETITTLDTSAQLTLSTFGSETLRTPARVHLRGDRSITWRPKSGYKAEFVRDADGKKVSYDVAGLAQTDEVLFLPIAVDGTMMRDKLSWDMVSLVMSQAEGFGGLPSRYVELFINDRYEGVYLMLKPFDIAHEMEKVGANSPMTDSLYRVSRLEMVKDRPILPDVTQEEIGFELFHAPDMRYGFDALSAYVDLLGEEDDEAFCRKALACIDLESLMRYELIMQAGGMIDNAANNLYIWAHRENGRFRYRFAFWDMDLTWGMYMEEDSARWVELPVADRVIALNPGGEIPQMIKRIWAQMKADGFTAERVEELITQYTHELGESGAYARDAQRWEKRDFYPDGYEIVAFAQSRFEMMDEWVDSLE